MPTHLISVTPESVDLCLVEGTPESDRADAIVAFSAFADGDHGDEILRTGMYEFHVEDDGNGLIGSPLCQCGHPRRVHRAERGHAADGQYCSCDSFLGWGNP